MKGRSRLRRRGYCRTFDRIFISRRTARRAVHRAMLRRGLLVLCVLAVCPAGVTLAQDRPTEPFDRAALLAKAAELAKQPHALPPNREPDGRRLTYDQYRSIRFDPAAAIWRTENRNFAVDLLYPGFIFDVPVNINLVVGGTARRGLFTNERVYYG